LCATKPWPSIVDCYSEVSDNSTQCQTKLNVTKIIGSACSSVRNVVLKARLNQEEDFIAYTSGFWFVEESEDAELQKELSEAVKWLETNATFDDAERQAILHRLRFLVVRILVTVSFQSTEHLNLPLFFFFS
jgi:hypothetical protein